MHFPHLRTPQTLVCIGMCRKMAWSICYLILHVSLAGCDLTLHGDSSIQKSRSHELVQFIRQGVEKDPSITSGARVDWLPSYSRLCMRSEPAVPQEECLNLVIESHNLDASKLAAMKLQAWLLQQDQRLPASLRRKNVVLTPISRKSGWSGEITPAAISKYFLVGESVRFTIGGN